MKRLIIGLAAIALAASASCTEMPDHWFDDSIYTDTFITGDCGMYWGDGIGKMFQTVLSDGMILGTDFQYIPGAVPEVESINVNRLNYLGFSLAAASFTFENDSLVSVTRLVRVDDIGDVAEVLTEINKIGSACGFDGTQDDPVFTLYWYDRRKNYMLMKSEQTKSGYEITITMVESGFWAKMMEQSAQKDK